ncbi:hypothetical protein ACWEIJ_19475 [Lentzea sp. NPDC004789]
MGPEHRQHPDQLALVERHFHRITGLQEDLTAFGRAMAAQQGHAELTHIPADAIEAWQETGPRRVRQSSRSSASRTRGTRPDDDDIAAGVRVFLHGHDVEKRREAAT